jgi:CRISPR/Cas system-associated endoribonuclease Cas2
MRGHHIPKKRRGRLRQLFVSFALKDMQGLKGVGNSTQFSIRKSRLNEQDIRKIERRLEELHDLEWVTITNYRFLEEEV